MKPPIPYYGGKMTLASRIAATFPAHQHYVEPYGGSLAVLLAKPRSPMETVNDLDRALMTFWRVLRDRPDDLMRVCALTPHSRAEHLEAYEPAEDELEIARRVWVQLTQGRGGSRRRTGWRYYIDPAGSVTSMPGYLEAYVGRMPPAATRLAGVSLECRPALELISAFGQCPKVLLYVDPPYLGSARSSRQYFHEMSHPEDHRELAEALVGCSAAVVVSGYTSPLYDELYGGWHRTNLDAFTGQGNKAGRRVEVLWCNRETEAALFPAVGGG
jgi:DNA adenine methylase